MNPRGVTLVELLAAISILVVVTALALPALQNRMTAARLDAAQGQLQAAALATRADAMRQGRSLSLTAHASPSGEVELVVAPLAGEDASTGSGSTSTADVSGRVGAAGSRWLTLPASIKINQQPPASTDRPERASKESASDARDVREKGPDSRDVRLALFCPDGSAVTSPVYLTDGDTVLIVTVNPWIGGVKFANFVAESRETATAEQSELKSSDSGDPPSLPKPAATKVPAAPPASSTPPAPTKGATR